MYMYIWLCNVPLRIYSKIKCCILCHLCVYLIFLRSHATLASSQHNTAGSLFILLMFYVHKHIRKGVRHYRRKFGSHLKKCNIFKLVGLRSHFKTIKVFISES